MKKLLTFYGNSYRNAIRRDTATQLDTERILCTIYVEPKALHRHSIQKPLRTGKNCLLKLEKKQPLINSKTR